MFGKPALLPPEPAREPERQALLPEQGVPPVSGSDGPDGVPLGEVHDEAPIGAEIPERMETPGEVVGVAQLIDRHLPHTRHRAHVQNDVAAVGDLDADLRESRARRAHQEGDDKEGAPLHRAVEEGREPGHRRVRRHPVVVGAGLILCVRADEGQVLGAGHVVRGAAVQVAAGELLLIQLDELPRGEAFPDEPLFFSLGAVAVDDFIRTGQAADLFDPLANGRRGRDRRLGRHMRWIVPRRNARARSRAAREAGSGKREAGSLSTL